jgi:hypothetical protein
MLSQHSRDTRLRWQGYLDWEGPRCMVRCLTWFIFALSLSHSISSPSFQSDIVSRVHFRVYSVIYDEDHVAEFPPLIYCEDRQSSNGTYVNNTLIGTLKSPRNPYLLNDGDMISIRPHWKFHFRQNNQSAKKSLDNVQTQEIEVFHFHISYLHSLTRC